MDPNNYENHVVTAEQQWTLLQSDVEKNICELGGHLGRFEWIFKFVKTRNAITLECKSMKQQGIYKDNIFVELFLYGRANEQEEYQLLKLHNYGRYENAPNPTRYTFCPSDYSYNFGATQWQQKYVSLTIRILEDRAKFWDFTVDKPFGHWQNNAKLKVGDTIFHVNKELLCILSPYFNRLFNNKNFVEAKNNLIETGESDAAIYNDFLMVLMSSKFNVLANSKNIGELMRLAKYYQIDSITEKLERTLKFAREIPLTERGVLAKKFGSKELLTSLLQSIETVDESKRFFLACIDE